MIEKHYDSFFQDLMKKNKEKRGAIYLYKNIFNQQ